MADKIRKEDSNKDVESGKPVQLDPEQQDEQHGRPSEPKPGQPSHSQPGAPQPGQKPTPTRDPGQPAR